MMAEASYGITISRRGYSGRGIIKHALSMLLLWDAAEADWKNNYVQIRNKNGEVMLEISRRDDAGAAVALKELLEEELSTLTKEQFETARLK